MALHSICLDFYVDDLDYEYDLAILLAYVFMRCFLHLCPGLSEQVQGDGEKKEAAENEPFEPVQRPIPKGLQMGWNFSNKMVFLC